MTGEGHTAVGLRKIQTPPAASKGKLAKYIQCLLLKLSQEPWQFVTQQSIRGGVFYPQPSKVSSSINFTGLGYLEMSLISQKSS